jgi:predicted aspartyl protease
MSRVIGNGKMGRVKVDVDLSNYSDVVLARAGHLEPEKVRRARVTGVVDTGATYLVLPKATAKQLGLPVRGKTRVRYADGRKAERAIVEGVQLELLGRTGQFSAIVEPRRDDMLIGAVVLEILDLLVDCRTQTLHPRDPDIIVTEIE